MNTARLAARRAGAVLVALSTLSAAQAAAPSAPPPEAEARRLLVEMSRHLAEERELTIEVRRRMDRALAPGLDAPEDARITVQVRRPDKLHATIRAGEDVRHVWYDGQTFTVFDETKNLYARTPMSGTIDDVVRRLDERFGFTPPLAEFVANDPHAFIRGQVNAARLGPTERIGGQQCRQLDLTGDDARAKLWVGQESRLPCRLEATFTRIDGNPELRVEFERWDLNADIPDSAFVFTPPKGAHEITMVPVEKAGGT